MEFFQDELSRSILELQIERFFELLTSKYWNASANAQCANSDDSEGITLESLGGVFIATLFGLALALVTLTVEIIYYRRKDRKAVTNASKKDQPFETKKSPPPSYDKEDTVSGVKGRNRHEVTFGSQFVPASVSNPSYIKVYPRRPIHPNTILDWMSAPFAVPHLLFLSFACTLDATIFHCYFGMEF